jgi:glycosyltransferase involved in cell wall biosynthesis
MSSAARPAPAPGLVSIVVVAYRQERFIRAAVRSAFAQTFSPLEIILCDDCSPDRTFEIMTEEAKAYHGPHKVVLNRNPRNLGLAGNYNRAAELSQGELVIVQDGDDISRPDRAAILARAALEPTPVDMVCSQVTVIDEEGRRGPPWSLPAVAPLTIDGALRQGSISALGCACAYTRELWTSYGPIPAEALQEDAVLPFRAYLGRGVRIIDEPLVQYRVHGANLFAGQTRRTRAQARIWARSALAIAEGWRADWVRAGRDPADFDRWQGPRRTMVTLDAENYDRSRLGALAAALRALAQGLTLRNFAGVLKRHVLRI